MLIQQKKLKFKCMLTLRSFMTISYGEFGDMYRQSPVKSPDIKNIIVITLTFLFEKFPTALKKLYFIIR